MDTVSFQRKKIDHGPANIWLKVLVFVFCVLPPRGDCATTPVLAPFGATPPPPALLTPSERKVVRTTDGFTLTEALLDTHVPKTIEVHGRQTPTNSGQFRILASGNILQGKENAEISGLSCLQGQVTSVLLLRPSPLPVRF